MARPVGWAGWDLLGNPGAEFPIVDRESADSSLIGRVMRAGEALLFSSRRNDVIGEDQMVLLKQVAANLSFALQYLNEHDAARFLAYFEPLTGLAKRALFCERLRRLLTRGTEVLPRANRALCAMI
jgi:GGDEF domain-containing protein